MSTFKTGYKSLQTVLHGNYYCPATFIYKNIFWFLTGAKRIMIYVFKNRRVFLKTCKFEDILLLLTSIGSIIVNACTLTKHTLNIMGSYPSH